MTSAEMIVVSFILYLTEITVKNFSGFLPIQTKKQDGNCAIYIFLCNKTNESCVF